MWLLAAQTYPNYFTPAFAGLCLFLGLVFPLVGTSSLRGQRKLGLILVSILLGAVIAGVGLYLKGSFGNPDADVFLFGLLLVVLIVVLFSACIVVDAGQPASFSETASPDAEAQQRSQIIADIPVGVWKLGPGGYTTTINQEMCRLLELDRPDDLSGTTYHSFFTPDSLNLLRLESFTATEPLPRIADAEIVSSNGRKRLVQVRSFPDLESDGKQTGLLLIVQDVSEARALETENRKLSTLPKFCPFPIMSFTSSAHLIYFNEAARELARSLGSEGDLAILPLDMQEIIKNCIASGQTTLQHEINLRGRTISWSFFPVKEAQVVHCYAVEISQRLTLENQLRQAQRMESVGQLAGGIAHDLNNLLNIIMGYTGLLQLRVKGMPEETEHLQRIVTATERAADLTQNLLTFSRKQIMQPKTLDLNEVLTGQTKLIQGILGNTVSLQTTYAPGLPPVQIDPAMVEQIITNLVSNASDAMPTGGQLIISTRLMEIDENLVGSHPNGRLGKFVCLSVADTGNGIELEIIGRIFEPFFSTKGGGKERGLGLAEVHSAIKQHRGWIEVSSQPRQGATFRIFLPATPQEWLETPGEAPAEPAKVGGGPEKILIVEDEPALLALASNVLESYGYEIMTAETGEEAIEKWKSVDGNIDLLLTDVVIPGGIGGSDLARQFRKEKPQLKIIYTSGFNKETLSADEKVEEGVNFLPKPYLSAALAQVVRTQLDRA
ncbi:MAG TPA: ATP-binding protein [Chthoniobacterales bacterium]|jgi:signal transduction histidine kinase